MAAIEYGSYYWCVILESPEAGAPGESVHLHADDLAIETNGGLTFRSAGRRPAGAEPKQKDDKQEAKDSSQDTGEDKKDEKDGKDGRNDKANNNMIYIAFAPGTWKVVYAAKLTDGSPASVEHWNTARGNGELPTEVPPNSGAAGFPARE
ncbi:MAG TPA: hypothetical protein VIH76_06940 [Candidatus Acidoferrales bacterium]